MKRTKIWPLALGCAVLAGCDGMGSAPRGETPPVATSSPGTGALMLLGGYRATDDPCRRVGETAATVDFLDHTADLVGCPEGSAQAATFAAEMGAQPISVIDGYQLFTVPRG
ncbi:hypothetical protein PVW48_13065 [Dinoroseobacter sp. PD6]|uniref:hypothetical protein n=1 Tax=Dinoroseobacter sp. PD6 TaxID=3028384 RepID=UPI00237BC5CC|nr:hypothetical protein [Dinoroseobacter sp. PD6]MDD9717683.1 hypothetical protein [Dinoroseobacter sp. PD6]